MEYLDEGRRASLVRAKNDLGETPLHLAVSFAGSARSGRAGGGGGGGSRGGSKREIGFAVQVRRDSVMWCGAAGGGRRRRRRQKVGAKKEVNE